MTAASPTPATPPGPFVAVCLKWVDRRPSVDPLTGEVATDQRTSGASPADEAALEWALRLAEDWKLPTVAVTAGGPASAAVLSQALAAGVDRVVRVELAAEAGESATAASLAEVLADAAMVVCGAWSLDGGTGAVPAFLAAHLGAAQALGLVGLDLGPGDRPGRDPGDGAGGSPSLRAVRRLDGGRREHLRIFAPAVVSVEADTARLRRSSLLGVLDAQRAPIEVHTPAGTGPNHPDTVVVGPYRPRTHALAPPLGDTARHRILALTGAATQRAGGTKVVHLPPDEAATAIVAGLRQWGYLP